MTRVRTLVVDDELFAREGLRDMLAADGDLLVGECDGGAAAVRAIERGDVDLVFLDVQMGEMSGFEVIEAVGAARMPVVVFTTAYDRYALQAFEVCALDYLLKPIGEERLERAVARAKEAVNQRRLGKVSDQLAALLAYRRPSTTADHALAPAPHAPKRREPTAILVSSGTREYAVELAQVDWISSADNYARLWQGDRSHLVREPLQRLAERLEGWGFVRVHRTAIVNVGRIREIARVGVGRYIVVLHGGRRVPLSRDRRSEVQRAMRHASSG